MATCEVMFVRSLPLASTSGLTKSTLLTHETDRTGRLRQGVRPVLPVWLMTDLASPLKYSAGTYSMCCTAV